MSDGAVEKNKTDESRSNKGVGLESNYDLFSLFISKEVKIWNKNSRSKYITLRIPSIRDFYTKDDINAVYHLWKSPVSKMNSLLGIKTDQFLVSSFKEFVYLVIFELGMYKEIKPLAESFKSALTFFFPHINIDMSKHDIILDNGVTMTNEICDYALYILKLSCGEKVSAPLVFTSEAARKFYLAQKENDEIISSIRSQSGKDKDGLLKTFLSIEYSFPSYSHEYLLDQTMAQIQWLQKLAAGAVSYEVNAKAFAAGNTKKNSKLEFFIK